MNKVSLQDALSAMSKLYFEDFTQNDWDAWAGCETDVPRIAYDPIRNAHWIIDGSNLYFYPMDDDNCDKWVHFEIGGPNPRK